MYMYIIDRAKKKFTHFYFLINRCILPNLILETLYLYSLYSDWDYS